jgi:hypothetical protein
VRLDLVDMNCALEVRSDWKERKWGIIRT